ncbi:MAG: LLM class flavin-dependent oxidoreductase [Candidatus Ranarchaeia archaeon]
MKFGILMLPDKSINEIVSMYQIAENAGVEYGWTCDEAPSAPFRDPYAVLAALGFKTGMKLGTAIHVPYTRHPGLLAYSIKSYDELFPGRMILGIGPGGVLSLKPLGLKMWDRPLKTMKESITICRRLLDGEEVTFEGEMFRLYNTKLYETSPQRIPIFIAARGPKMLQLAGELADGALCSLPAKTVEWAVEQINLGMEKGGKKNSDFTLVSGLPFSVDTDYEKARTAVKKELIPTIVYASPKTHELTGVSTKSLEKLKEAVGGGWSASSGLITDEMIDLYSVTGTPGDVIEQLKDYEKKGIKIYNLTPPFGPDPKRSFELIKNEIIPALT